jgi:hypothetical protein
MADKIASGSWHEGGPPRREDDSLQDADAHDPGPAPGHDPRETARRAEADRLRARRDNARWSAVVGFALLFAASFSSAFLFGGVGMIVYGVTATILWSARLRKVEGDPWAYDAELDGPDAPDWSRK